MNSPIGIFDSGVGGLTVWKEIVNLFPYESTIYLADSLNCPYGEKPNQEIIELSIKNVEFLLSKKCKIIVVACNTATAAAISTLRSKYKVLFVGVEPAVKPAAINSKTKNVGILATVGTFNGNHFQNTSNRFAKDVNLHTQIGFGLVEYVEKGDFNNNQLKEILASYINPMLDKNVDNIVLGCTHYPFLIDLIKKIAGNHINIVNPAPAVAKRLQFLLYENNLNKLSKTNPIYEFYTNGDIKILDKLVKIVNRNRKVIVKSF